MSSAPKRHSPAIGTVIGGLMLLAIAVAVLGALLAVIGLVALRARR